MPPAKLRRLSSLTSGSREIRAGDPSAGAHDAPDQRIEGAQLGEDSLSGVFVELFGPGVVSEATSKRGIPTLRPQGLAGELDSVAGWRAVLHLLDTVRADAASVADVFLVGGGSEYRKTWGVQNFPGFHETGKTPHSPLCAGKCRFRLADPPGDFSADMLFGAPAAHHLPPRKGSERPHSASLAGAPFRPRSDRPRDDPRQRVPLPGGGFG